MRKMWSNADHKMIDLRALLPQRKLKAHVVGWFGSSGHIDVGYHSDDPKIISRQMDLLHAVGVYGTIHDWRGSAVNPTQHAALLGWTAEAQLRGNHTVEVMADVGMIGSLDKVSATVLLGAQLTGISNVLQSPAYGAPGRIFQFGMEGRIDWTQIPYTVLTHGTDYLWIEIPTKPPDTALAILQRQYATAPVKVGAVFSQFDDRWPTNPIYSCWPDANGNHTKPARVVDGRQGRLWLDTWAAIPPSVQEIQLVTFDDIEEGTALYPEWERVTGIRIG